MTRSTAARRIVIILAMIAASVPRADADWPVGGLPVCQSCDQPRIAPDNEGGAYVVWMDRRNNNANIYVQRLTPSGTAAPGWPPEGIPICASLPHARFYGQPVNDGLGGLIVTWHDGRNVGSDGTDFDIYAQRIMPDGSIAPGWPVNGAEVTRSPNRDEFPVVIADGTGGAFIAWQDAGNLDVFLQHVTGVGSVASGWPADGLPVCVLPSSQGVPMLVPDAAGGVLLVWSDLRDGPISVYAQHVTIDGSLASGWPENGRRIVLDRARRALLPDGEGGAFLACATTLPVHDDDYYLQRFTGDGTIAPGWPEGGVPVCLAPDERNAYRMIADGTGGVFLAWSDYRDFSDNDIFALRVQPDGTRAPGWPLDGLRVTDNTALDDRPELAPDERGGFYLVWESYTTATGDRVTVQHLTGDGAVWPGWPAGGRIISADGSWGDAVIAPDGTGGAIVAWQHGQSQIRALRIGPDGPVAAVVSLASATAEPGLVRLTWFVAGGAVFTASVERRSATSDWERIGGVSPDGAGHLTYEDRSVAAGTRYAYRLAYRDGADLLRTAEVWVEVPLLRLALQGIAPNPSRGDPVITFSLASHGAATLDLYDLAGRAVDGREVGALGPGIHQLRLGERGRLPAGVYTVRLRQGEHTAIARAVILR